MSLSDFLNNRRKKKSGATRGSLTKKEFQKLSKTASNKGLQGRSGSNIRSKAKRALSKAGAVTEEQATKKAAKAQKQSNRLAKALETAKTGKGRNKISARKLAKRLTDKGVTTPKQKKKRHLKITTWRDLE